MSVLLDTSVVSELLRKVPDPAVETWAAGHALEELFFSAVGEAELRYGAALLPTGRRRESLVSDIEAMLRDAFDDRVLPFDSRAARACAAILACSPRHAGVRKRLPRVRQGRPRMTPTFEPLAGSVREILCLRGHRHRRSPDGGMNGMTEAFARVRIDALLKDAGWSLTDGSSVLFEHALPNGTQADYVLCDRQGPGPWRRWARLVQQILWRAVPVCCCLSVQ